jgi:hypothetical protein
MITSNLVIQILTYSFALWLGLYLLARDFTNRQLRLTGFGLIVYALGLVCQIFNEYGTLANLPDALPSICQLLFIAPALLWTGAIINLMPDESSLRNRLASIWLWFQIPMAVLLFLIGSIISPTSQITIDHPIDFLFVIVILVPLLVAFVLLVRISTTVSPKNFWGLLITALILFTLSTAFLLIPIDWIPRQLLVFSMGFDLILLGLVIAIMDAFAQGEAFLPDLIRSFSFTSLTVISYGGFVTLVIAFATGLTTPMLALQIVIITIAIASQTVNNPFHSLLERLIFARSPQLRKERAELRAAVNSIPKIDDRFNTNTISEDDFVRLTRRALSYYSNLPRLATNPLTRLPMIEKRLNARKISPTSLTRATELKEILTEAIFQLKPRAEGSYGTSEEWRFFNSLYYPYLVGLKPYSRRADFHELAQEERIVLEWFRAQVPERTLYNWQKAAAKLIAQYIREMAETGS